MVYPVTGWIDGERIAYTVLRKDARQCGPLQAFIGLARGGQLSVRYVEIFTDGEVSTGSDSYHKE